MNQKGLSSLLLIILLVSVILGVYFIYTQQLKFTLSQNLIVTSQTSPAPSSTSTETANWKIYQNDYFSFKYPLNWTVKETKNPNSLTDLSEVILTENKQAAEIIFLVKSHTDRESTIQTFPNEQKIVIDGIEGAKSFGYGGEAGTVDKTVIVLTRPETEYYILGNNYSGSTFEDFYPILSTFTFLDKNSNDFSWKTYTNTKFSYSIKYPSTYYLLNANQDEIQPKGNEDIVYFSKYPSAEVKARRKSSNWQTAFEDGITIRVYWHCKYGRFDQDPNFSNSKKESIFIDGYRGIKWTGTPRYEPFIADVSVDINKGSSCYQLYFLRNNNNIPASETFINQILSTFKFIP